MAKANKDKATAATAAETEKPETGEGAEAGAAAGVPATTAVDLGATAGMTDAISGVLELGSVEVDEGGKPVETKTVTILKGKVGGNVRYQAFVGGVSGSVSASIAAAINTLLENGLKVLPKAWAVPKNEKDVKFPQKGDNKPKEPESLDDLSPERADHLKEQMDALEVDVQAYADARSRTFETVRRVSTRVRDLRMQYTKAEWTIFGKLAEPNSEVARLLTAKNTLGEMVFFANIPDALIAFMPEGKKTPKAAQAWVNGLRATLAHTIVDVVKLPANAETFEGMGVTDAVRKVINDHYDGVHALAFDEQDATMCLLGLHHGAWPDGGLFDALSDGTYAPARDDNGKHITTSVFGSEGADELVKALANAFNAWKSPEVKAAVDDMKARAKAVVSSDFTKISADAAALHIFNILAARLKTDTEESLAATTDDCLAIVDKLGGWLDAVAAGTMTVADVLASGPKPTTEGEAEQEGDANA